MMKNKALQKILTVAALLASLALLAVGAVRTREIHDKGNDTATIKVGEKQLVADSTFGGVERKDGHLSFTYDRNTAKKGKKDCPT